MPESRPPIDKADEALTIEPAIGDYPTIAASKRSARLQVGSVVGAYRIADMLGEGGFGAVYLAEQTEPIQRQVALKILKIGMDTEQVIARFEAERQALAVMDHPNVARVFDAGTTDRGRPFFVMELVRGEPITAYADARGLDIRQRLQLVLDVCSAVQHAHQKGLIHRDLKPSNVLVGEVDGKPLVKVIDFGIAKAIDQRGVDQPKVTIEGQFIGTPEYMSPEQADPNCRDIDTRTDIYALGVLLYELLTGSLPFDAEVLRSASFDEMQRIIREDDPPRPSNRLSGMRRAGTTSGGATPAETALVNIARHRQTDPGQLQRKLRGDLDWIVVRCLEKDRTRRYETANGLALEIGRFLNDEPVLAGPPSSTYRMRKFVRRNRSGVLATAAVALAVVVGLVFAIVGFARANASAEDARYQEGLARAARDQAQNSADEAGAVNAFLLEMLTQADPWKSGGQVTIAEALERADKNIETSFVHQPRIDAAVRRTIGDAYRGIGLLENSENHLLRAARRYEQLDGATHRNTLETHALLAELRVTQDQLDVAASITESLVGRAEVSLGSDHAETLRFKSILATVYHRQGRWEEAETLTRSVLESQTKLFGKDDENRLNTLNDLAWLLLRVGKLDEAELAFLERKAAIERIDGADDPEMIVNTNGLATVWFDQGRFDEAEDMYRTNVERSEAQLGEDHPDVMIAVNGLANVLRNTGRLAESEPLSRRFLETYERRLGPDHQHTLIAANNLGQTLAFLNRFDEAEALFTRTLETRIRTLGEDHPDVGESYGSLGTLHMRQDQLPEAEQMYRRSIDVYRAAFGRDTGDTVNSMVNLSVALNRQGKYDEAAEVMAKVVKFSRDTLPPGHRYIGNDLKTLADALHGAGDHAGAEAAYREALAIRTNNREPDDPVVINTQAMLAGELIHLNRFAEARALLEDAHARLERTDRGDADDRREIADWFVQLFETWEKPDEAEHWRGVARLLMQDDAGDGDGAVE